MTILPKTPKPTAAEERRAYQIATYRDGGEIVDGGICQMCLRDCGPTARDHRQNRQPGNTVAANLQVLGLEHHTWKTEHPEDAVAEGWAVPSWADPLVWPARRWRQTVHGMVALAWCLYDNKGGVHWITDEEALRRMEGLVA